MVAIANNYNANIGRRINSIWAKFSY